MQIPTTHRDKGYWKMNVRLFDDPLTVSRLNETWTLWKRPLSHYAKNLYETTDSEIFPSGRTTKQQGHKDSRAFYYT
jgi:hypothetical protein